jgi:hypothetical protein
LFDQFEIEIWRSPNAQQICRKHGVSHNVIVNITLYESNEKLVVFYYEIIDNHEYFEYLASRISCILGQLSAKKKVHKSRLLATLLYGQKVKHTFQSALAKHITHKFTTKHVRGPPVAVQLG